MSVDKFGHYINDTSGVISMKNAPKLLGFFMDTDNNIDVQNKRIKHMSNALEENDGVNKMFLQSQIEKTQKEVMDQLNKNINEVYQIIEKIKKDFERRIKILNQKLYNRLDIKNKEQEITIFP